MQNKTTVRDRKSKDLLFQRQVKAKLRGRMCRHGALSVRADGIGLDDADMRTRPSTGDCAGIRPAAKVSMAHTSTVI